MSRFFGIFFTYDQQSDFVSPLSATSDCYMCYKKNKQKTFHQTEKLTSLPKPDNNSLG